MNEAPITVAALLTAARTTGVDRLDAQLLLAHHLGRPRSWVIAHEDAVIEPRRLGRLRTDLGHRAAGMPLAYLTGTREFHGLDLRVTPDVLVPRPDTETLVDWAIELANALRSPSVIDLGTGSGAIALALKTACPAAQVVASDASDAALAVARANAASLGLDVRFIRGDWWAAAGSARFDLAVCNPPYIAAGDPHLAALAHEPRQALTAGHDGLEAIGRVIAGAMARLAPGGWLLLEHGSEQAEAVAAMLLAGSFDRVESRRDMAGSPRCSGGRCGRG